MIDFPDKGSVACDRFFFNRLFDSARWGPNYLLAYGINDSVYIQGRTNTVAVIGGTIVIQTIWRFLVENPLQYQARDTTGTDPN